MPIAYMLTFDFFSVQVYLFRILLPIIALYIIRLASHFPYLLNVSFVNK